VTLSNRNYASQNTTVLVVDEDADFLAATCLLLDSEGYTNVGARSAKSALSTLRERRVDVMLVAYWPSDLVGERFVREVRAVNREVRIVLLTVHANEQPARALLRSLEIQGFCDKSEGPERLLLWTDVAAKAASVLARLEDGRKALTSVLSATASFHHRHDKDWLFSEILERIAQLVSAVGAILAIFPDALGEDGDLLLEEATGASARVVAGWGSFSAVRDFTRVLEQNGYLAVRQCLAKRSSQIVETWVAQPLRVGEHMLGFVASKVEECPKVDPELLDVLAHQASVAIQNSIYYEMAALDPLTGVHARRFFEVWTRREVRAALRTGTPLGVLLIDMDGLKELNDRGGHRVGDSAIATLGRVLRETTREHDLAARIGGDEFVMLMPQTDLDGASAVAKRIVESLSGQTVQLQGESRVLGVSIGVGVLQSRGPCPAAVGRGLTTEFFAEIVERLVRRADDALYEAKRCGRGQYRRSDVLEIPWSSTERPPIPSSEEFA
jgi:diguanylate cyclase (GGDEF)-like protein